MVEQPLVAIVVPTMNRADFMIRQLVYFADAGCRHTVYVGDSSEDGEAERVSKAIQRLGERLNVVHLHLAGLNNRQAIREILHTASEPYAAFVGDDDFLIPSSLDECALFLDTNPDYATAQGVAAMCGIEGSAKDYRITSSGRYGLRFVEGTSAAARLAEFMGNSFETLFSVHRTEEFRNRMDTVMPVPDENFSFFLLSCLAVIQGRSKQLEPLYLVRLVHPSQNRLPSGFDWIASENWYPSYKIFCDTLAEAITQKDHISVDEAHAVVKQALRLWVAPRMFEDSGANSMKRYGRIYQRFRKAVGNVPKLGNTLRKMRSYLPTQDKMSLDVLLRSSSPYHDDFMPIYRAKPEAISGGHDRPIG